MEKKYRLRKNLDFRKVYNKGKNFWNRNLVLYVKKNELEETRLGITVTKKIGNAVVRNKVRRRIREIYRLNLYRIEQGYDLIIIPKKNVTEISYKELENAFIHILKISDMLKD
jgi:ribonuclease P protein component